MTNSKTYDINTVFIVEIPLNFQCLFDWFENILPHGLKTYWQMTLSYNNNFNHINNIFVFNIKILKKKKNYEKTIFF